MVLQAALHGMAMRFGFVSLLFMAFFQCLLFAGWTFNTHTVYSYGMGLLLIPAGGRLGILSVGRVGRTVVF